MSQLTAATCARCGAPLRLDPSTPKQVCTFCGNEHLFEPTRTPPPPFQPRPFAPQPFSPPAPVVVPPAAPTFVGVAFALSVVLAIVGAVVAVVVGQGSGNSSALPGGGGVVPAGEHLQWSANGASVVPARIDGDSVEDFVGRYVILDLGGQTTQTLFVGGFSGATFARVWKAGPYGTLQEGLMGTHLAVAGDRVAVTDFRSTLHVLDVATGKELRSVRLSDRAQSVCAPADGRKQVWVEVVDRNHQIIDLDSGKAEAAARPAWCRSGGSLFHGCAGARASCSEETKSAPKQPGFGADLVFTDGSTAVATGHKEPGTRTPMVIGFDTTSKTVAWSTMVPADPASFGGLENSAGDLVAGRFFTTYGLNDQKGSRLVSLDAKSGARRWDVAVPRSESGSGVAGLTATSTRVYVPHWTWLDVFDAASGKHLGTVGVW